MQGGNTGNGLRRGKHIFHDLQVVDAFTRAGYTLESNDEDENGWVPLDCIHRLELAFSTTSGDACTSMFNALVNLFPHPECQYMHMEKWGRMLVPRSRDAGGNIQTWAIDPAKEHKLSQHAFKGVARSVTMHAVTLAHLGVDGAAGSAGVIGPGGPGGGCGMLMDVVDGTNDGPGAEADDGRLYCTAGVKWEVNS